MYYCIIVLFQTHKYLFVFYIDKNKPNYSYEINLHRYGNKTDYFFLFIIYL